MNLTALEKVARIGCKYDLPIPFYVHWAPPSGGLSQEQQCCGEIQGQFWI